MTNQPRPMSATARAVLSLAATRDDHLVALPRLPVAVARQVIRSMLNAGLVEELSAAAIDPGYVWRAGEDGEVISLRATALGLARVEGSARAAIASVSAETAGGAAAEIGVPAETDPKVRVTALMPASEDMPATTAQTSQGVQERPDDANLGDDTAPVLTQTAEGAQKPATAAELAGRRVGLRQAARALLDAWDELTGSDRNAVDALVRPFDGLRAALATASSSGSTPTDTPRALKDTKQARVLAMLRRHEGASGPQIADEMSWAPHTVRGFLAGLAKKGIKVRVLERVRQVGPNKVGAKGSYSVYRLAAEAEE